MYGTKNCCFLADKQTAGMGLVAFSPVVAAQLWSGRPCRRSPRTSESSATRGWWWWPGLASALLAASQISGKRADSLHSGVVHIRYESAQICFTGLQVAVSMTTCSSTTCPMQRPYLRSTFSITTQILSLLWPKNCIQGTTSPIWPITLWGCFTIRGSFCGCTRKTLMAWKDVCIFNPFSTDKI